MKEGTNTLLDRFDDIVTWTARMRSHIGTADFAAFQNDTMMQDAVIRCLEVIGEAAGHILKIDPQADKNYPGLALKQAYRARNRTAHGYGAISLDVIWQTATVDAPELAMAAGDILNERRRS